MTATADLLSPEKRAQILRGAALVFAESGYEGASVARIAAEAGVSKGTLYNHFESKAELFAAWVETVCAGRLAGLFADGDGGGDLAAALRGIGRRMIAMMLSGDGETIYRMVVSEAAKFPELARSFFDSGPSRAIGLLAGRLARETEAGRLAVDDPAFAAEQFFTLCQTRIVMRCKLHLRDAPSEAEVAHVVDSSVAMFLNTYARPAENLGAVPRAS